MKPRNFVLSHGNHIMSPCPLWCFTLNQVSFPILRTSLTRYRRQRNFVVRLQIGKPIVKESSCSVSCCILYGSWFLTEEASPEVLCYLQRGTRGYRVSKCCVGLPIGVLHWIQFLLKSRGKLVISKVLHTQSDLVTHKEGGFHTHFAFKQWGKYCQSTRRATELPLTKRN